MYWKITENKWSEEYCWFLVDEGRIQYAFKDRSLAIRYKKQGFMNFMLLTNLDNITNDTMLDPEEFSSWDHKVQTCLDWADQMPTGSSF